MSLRVDILTLFPEMFGGPPLGGLADAGPPLGGLADAGPFGASIIGRAQASGAIEIALHNPRDYTRDKHRVVDDYAYGGGPGMVMKPEPLFDCVDAVRAMDPRPARVVLLTPQGRRLDHGIVAELAACERLIIVCGHYEGFDERVREHLADDEISIGDYVLSGGEPAAIVLTDAVARYQPGVLGSEQSLEEESHAQGLLEYPQYTRPPEYRGLVVPGVLLSGHHADVAAWRRRQSIERTARRRPDLLARATLTPEERRWAEEATAAVPVGVARVRRIVLMTDNIDRDAAFYATLLATDGARTAPGQHEFALGPTTLSLLDGRIAGLPRSGVGHDRGPEPSRTPIVFSVPDLKAAHARALTAGCSWLDDRIRRQPTGLPLGGPADAGERGFAARDPSGNALVFVEER